jgi:hypothetical protein
MELPSRPYQRHPEMPMPDPIEITITNAADIRLFVYVYDRSQGADAAPVFAEYLDPGEESREIEVEYYEAYEKYSICWLTQAAGRPDLGKTMDVDAAHGPYEVIAGSIEITITNAADIPLFVYVYDRGQGAGAAPVFAEYLDPEEESREIEVEYYEAYEKYSIRWLTQAADRPDLGKTVDVDVAHGPYEVTAGV